MEEKTITPFTDLPYEAFEALSQYMNATGGTMSGFSVGKGGFRGGTQARQIAMFSESGNERVLVGKESDPLVLLGQLKDKTGTDEYGLWVKTGAAYIGGMRVYEAIVDPAGDGDYTTIAAAITAGKKIIFLRNGTHILSADLTISTAGTVLIGESRDGVIIQSGATSGADDHQIIVSGHYVQLRNFNKTKLSAGSLGAIKITGNHAVVDNVYVTNEVSGGYGIHITGGYATVQNSEVYSDYAINSTGSNSTITNNKLTQYSANVPTVLIDGINASLIGNYIYGTCYNSDSDLGIVTVTVDSAKITDNLIVGGSYTGLGMCITSDNSVISNNKITLTLHGVRVQTAYGTVMAGNTIYSIDGIGVQVGFDAAYGIDKFTLNGNTIMNAGGDGVQIRDAYNCSIINNIIDTSGGTGIEQISGQIEQCNISNNQVNDCTADGIKTTGASDCKYSNIIGNVIYNNGARGLYIGASHCNVIANISYSNVTADSITNTSGNTQYNIS